MVELYASTGLESLEDEVALGLCTGGGCESVSLPQLKSAQTGRRHSLGPTLPVRATPPQAHSEPTHP